MAELFGRSPDAKGAAWLLEQWGVEERYVSRYDMLAEQFSETQTILTRPQGEHQVYIDKLY